MMNKRGINMKLKIGKYAVIYPSSFYRGDAIQEFENYKDFKRFAIKQTKKHGNVYVNTYRQYHVVDGEGDE